MISVRSEVQILPGPPVCARGANWSPRQRWRSHRGSGPVQREAPVSAALLEPSGLSRLPPSTGSGATAGARQGFLGGAAAQKPWGCSSVGRAPALQAGGHRFDSVHLHQPTLRSSGGWCPPKPAGRRRTERPRAASVGRPTAKAARCRKRLQQVTGLSPRDAARAASGIGRS